MKKTVLALITFICLTTAVNAQTGSILLYGNVGFNTNSNGGNDNGSGIDAASKGSFYINPGVGYQFNNAWTVGVEGGYNYYDMTISIERDYSAGGFLRYAKPIMGIFSAYAQLGIGYQGQTIDQDSLSSTGSGFYAKITPAIYANIKNSFGLNFSVGGLGYSSLSNSGVTKSTFGLTFGKELSIGLSKNFGGK
jgi:hypothetical protein